MFVTHDVSYICAIAQALKQGTRRGIEWHHLILVEWQLGLEHLTLGVRSEHLTLGEVPLRQVVLVVLVRQREEHSAEEGSVQLPEEPSVLPLRQVVLLRQREEGSVPLPEGPSVSAVQLSRQLKEGLVVALVRQMQARLQVRALELLLPLPSALQLHPQLKERSVVGLEQQREEVCSGQLREQQWEERSGQLRSLSGHLPEGLAEVLALG